MADRESVFSDQRVIDLLNDRFVALTGDDWYWRRQQDAIGEFHRQVTDQGPRGGGSGTRQGRYVFTADGRLLGFNNNRSPERLLAMLNQTLEEWQALPAEQRSPRDGAALVGSSAELELEPRFDRRLPEGVTVLRCWTRALEWDSAAQQWEACASAAESGGGRPAGAMAARDHLWLQAEELAALAEQFAALTDGETADLPERLGHRLARFHLVDNTRGEPPMWNSGDIRDWTWQWQRINADTARLTGSFDLATNDGGRSYRGHLDGELAWQPAAPNGNGAARQLAALELRALGLHEGQGSYTPGARPGATPLAVVLELVPDPQPADRVPPQASRDLHGYWQAGINP